MPRQQHPVHPDQRSAVLTQARNLKMARSAHAYVRGNTRQFYEWLDARLPASLPEGPSIWICGDCHSGNLGPIGNTQGHVEVQIRDLDQTVIGNPAHDLIRLGLSLAMAARGSDLPGVTTALMIERLVEGYMAVLRPADADGDDAGTPLVLPLPAPVHLVFRAALGRSWKHLARERFDNPMPRIPLGRTFWKLAAKERAAIVALFQTTTSLACVAGIPEDARHAVRTRVLDAAYWMKGCSSLGRLRYAVVLGIQADDGQPPKYCLVDIKEAIAAAAPAAAGTDMPRQHAMRVVTGARQLSPHLGDRMVATSLLGRAVFLRELLPQDLKLNIDQLTRGEATAVASFLGAVVGKAHARQLDAAAAKRWHAELSRNHTKSLDAPSWLWNSVVDLVASHEAQYLQHCRRHALKELADA